MRINEATGDPEFSVFDWYSLLPEEYECMAVALLLADTDYVDLENWYAPSLAEAIMSLPWLRSDQTFGSETGQYWIDKYHEENINPTPYKKEWLEREEVTVTLEDF